MSSPSADIAPTLSSNLPPPAARRGFTPTEVGLAIGFGIPFVAGLVDRLLILLGWAWGPHIGIPWLLADLAILGALLALVHYWERLPLTSVGINWPTSSDLIAGVAVYLALMVLMIAVPFLYTLIQHGTREEFATGFEPLAPTVFTDLRALPLWLALAIVVTAGFATELAIRGFGIERLRALTGSVAGRRGPRAAVRPDRSSTDLGTALHDPDRARRSGTGRALFVAPPTCTMHHRERPAGSQRIYLSQHAECQRSARRAPFQRCRAK